MDKVLNPETHEYYSSKPPLLTVLMAGEYWLLKHALGWSIDGQTNEIVRIGLLTFNVLPLILYLWMMGRLAERLRDDRLGPALRRRRRGLRDAALDVPHHVQQPRPRRLRHADRPVRRAAGRVSAGRLRGLAPRLARDAGRLVVAGLAAGFLVNCELPAAAFVAALGLLLLRVPGRTLLWFSRPCCS